MPAYLTRRVSFAAAHRYRIAAWSDERNEQVFGLCARPSYHGHSYVCDVTVRGDIDATTGFVVDLGVLDRILDIEVREPDFNKWTQLARAKHRAASLSPLRLRATAKAHRSSAASSAGRPH